MILFASTNSGKLVEVRQIAAEFGLVIVGLREVEARLGPAPEVVESADTYLGNAELKARAYAGWSGMSVLADDTGLEVAALAGLPGVLSARYAGPGASATENRDKLLGALSGIQQRKAQFVCVLAYLSESGELTTASAVLPGEIARSAAGSGGFGYDSIFYLSDRGSTLAEAKANRVQIDTHRIKALRTLFEKICECS